MADYLIGALGIIVSVVLFLVGYRQTIGAKKERIKSANADLERILVRRIVLEKYNPKVAEVSRLIEGKARDFRVRSTDLLSETQILITVYTRIMESDLISAEQRDEILARVEPVLAESEGEPMQEEAIEEVSLSEKRFRATQAAVALMAIMTSVIGGLVTVIPELSGIEARFREIIPMIASTTVLSLTAIAVFYALQRLRASQEETTNKAKELSKYVSFEQQVRKSLADLGSVLEPSGSEAGVDFIIERGSQKIAIEVKSWSRPVPTPIVMRIVKQARSAAMRLGSKEAIIVTAGYIPNVKFEENSEVKVKLMSLKELRNYIAHFPQ